MVARLGRVIWWASLLLALVAVLTSIALSSASGGFGNWLGNVALIVIPLISAGRGARYILSGE